MNNKMRNKLITSVLVLTTLLFLSVGFVSADVFDSLKGITGRATGDVEAVGSCYDSDGSVDVATLI